jgi:AcrR family transcriptional regulator
VATELLADRGYEATSMEAILERAGASRGSLYHHFAGKDRLFEAVLEAVHLRCSTARMGHDSGLS